MKWMIAMVPTILLTFSAGGQAQPLQADTLGDLKAEYEFQQEQAAPYIAAYEQANAKKMECYNHMITVPSSTNCDSEDAVTLRVASLAATPVSKLVEAKDAYEREQRKHDRRKAAAEKGAQEAIQRNADKKRTGKPAKSSSSSVK